MKYLVLALLLSTSLYAQQAPVAKPAPQPKPTLTASQTIALQAVAEKIAELQKQYQVLGQQQQAIIAEFAYQHPGWTINPQTGEITALPKK
jgi:hypothetical protein